MRLGEQWLLLIFVTGLLLLAYPVPVLVVGGLGLVLWGVTTWHHKRHVTQVELCRRAEREHWCHMNGCPVGTYGQYAPAEGFDDARRL